MVRPTGKPYPVPPPCGAAFDSGLLFCPAYRAVRSRCGAFSVCLATWYVIERTSLGAHLRAATENPGG